MSRKNRSFLLTGGGAVLVMTLAALLFVLCSRRSAGDGGEPAELPGAVPSVPDIPSPSPPDIPEPAEPSAYPDWSEIVTPKGSPAAVTPSPEPSRPGGEDLDENGE